MKALNLFSLRLHTRPMFFNLKTMKSKVWNLFYIWSFVFSFSILLKIGIIVVITNFMYIGSLWIEIMWKVWKHIHRWWHFLFILNEHMAHPKLKFTKLITKFLLVQWIFLSFIFKCWRCSLLSVIKLCCDTFWYPIVWCSCVPLFQRWICCYFL